MIKFAQKKRLALVLSGGGIKAAAFHIGVCIALREKGFKFAGGSKTSVEHKYESDNLTFKIYVGSSAGAVVSTFLATGFSIDAVIDAFTQGAGLKSLVRTREHEGYLRPITYRDLFALNINAGTPSRFLSRLFKKKPMISGGLEVLLKRGVKVNGLFSTRNLERYLRTTVCPTNKFDALGVKLFIVATQLNHSRKVVFGPYAETTKNKDVIYAGYSKISEAVAASASLPPFFAPYGIKNLEGKDVYFFDGEIRDTLSTHVAAEHGADLVISSYSIQPYHYNEAVGSLHEYGMPVIFNQALYQTVQQKIESHIKHQKDVKTMIKAIDGYLREANIGEEHRTKLIEILSTRTNFNPEVDYIYIHPNPHDYEMFFYDHFSLNPAILGRIVRTGFKAAMNAMRAHHL
jgi:predicted acylesterase/phospholipase RssA